MSGGAGTRAATDAQRETVLAAGQALLANWSGTAFDVGYLLSGIAILITAGVMLRSGIFGKFIAYTGLMMGVLMLVSASAGTAGLMRSLSPSRLRWSGSSWSLADSSNWRRHKVRIRTLRRYRRWKQERWKE